MTTPDDLLMRLKKERDAIQTRRLSLRLIGTAPLIVAQWRCVQYATDAARERAHRRLSTPQGAYNAARYRKHIDGYTPDLIDVLPTSYIKHALISACRLVEGISMTTVRANAYVTGVQTNMHVKNEWAPIERDAGKPYFGERGSKYAPVCREDAVRYQRQVDVRYRPEYSQWEIPITVAYNADALSADELMKLFHVAGPLCGLGTGRPMRGGAHGTFDVRREPVKRRA